MHQVRMEFTERQMYTHTINKLHKRGEREIEAREKGGIHKQTHIQRSGKKAVAIIGKHQRRTIIVIRNRNNKNKYEKQERQQQRQQQRKRVNNNIHTTYIESSTHSG